MPALPHRPIQEYPSWNRTRLLQRYAEIIYLLTTCYEEYYKMQADEVRIEAETWMSSAEETISGKERDTKLSTYHIRASVLEQRAEIESLRLEQQFLLMLLERGSHAVPNKADPSQSDQRQSA